MYYNSFRTFLHHSLRALLVVALGLGLVSCETYPPTGRPSGFSPSPRFRGPPLVIRANIGPFRFNYVGSQKRYPPPVSSPYSRRVAQRIDEEAREKGLSQTESHIAENLLGILVTQGFAMSLDQNNDVLSKLLSVYARASRYDFIANAIKEGLPDAPPAAVDAMARIAGLILDGSVNGPAMVDTLSRGAFLQWTEKQDPQVANTAKYLNFLYLFYRTYHPIEG